MQHEVLSLARLKEALSYDKTTGLWTALINRGSRVKAGSIVGIFRKDGYIELNLDKKPYLSHRLAWFYVKGIWPEHDIDHKDLDSSNNKWTNIRLATRQQNNANSKTHKNNTSGSKGVSFIKKTKRWRAYIRVNYKFIHLGTYPTLNKAASAYDKAALRHFGKFTITNGDLHASA